MKKSLISTAKKFIEGLKGNSAQDIETAFDSFQEWTQSTLKEVDAKNIKAILDPLAQVLKKSEEGENKELAQKKNETIIATAKEAYRSVNVYIMSHEGKGIANAITSTIKFGFVTGLFDIVLTYFLS